MTPCMHAARHYPRPGRVPGGVGTWPGLVYTVLAANRVVVGAVGYVCLPNRRFRKTDKRRGGTGQWAMRLASGSRKSAYGSLSQRRGLLIGYKRRKVLRENGMTRKIHRPARSRTICKNRGGRGPISIAEIGIITCLQDATTIGEIREKNRQVSIRRQAPVYRRVSP